MSHFSRVVDVIFIFLILFSLVPLKTVHAQEENALVLRLNRNFGYSSGTGRIQGRFTAKVEGPENLTKVIFLIDGEEMGEAAQPPFELAFNTDSYPLGVHTITALGNTQDGRELASNEWKVEFVAAEEGWQTVGKIIIPLLGVIIIAMLASFVLPSLLGRGRKSSLPLGASRSYGIIGGTICPKCQRPFGMHIWGLNLVIGKLDRCPHCGSWSLVRHIPAEMLRSAEIAELSMSGQVETSAPQPDEESIKKELEDSRYQDL